MRDLARRGLRAVLPGLAAALFAVPAGAEAPPALTAAEAMDAVMWGEAPIGGAFTLTDHHGVVRTEADFLGRVVLVYFGFTYCPDICPTDLAAIGGALNLLGEQADQVQPLFITLDPLRDDDNLAWYVGTFHERLIGLTGDEAAIRATANAYSVYYEVIPGPDPDDYLIDHTAFVYLYDRSGAYRGFFPPGTGAGQIAEVLRPLLED